jgi:Na+/H+ antiporter NhaD/arsenite permease-like protein
MDTKAILAIVIFGITYFGILTEKVHKTVAALMGGMAMIMLRVVTDEDAWAAIDLNVLFLLTGMMILSHFLAESGFFGYAAIRLAQFVKGRPIPLLAFLCVVTGVLSALVDNVTTIVLIAPVTFLIAEQLEVNPVPFLLFEVMAANIGGTATLIGDPPNILIGSKAGLTFNQFVLNLGPVVLICLVFLVVVAILVVRRHSHVSLDVRARVMDMNPARAITDRVLLIKSGTVLLCVLALFVLHEVTHVSPAVAALAGAAVLLMLTKAEPDKAFQAVEWPTLFFFIGLFTCVEGLIATGVIEGMAEVGMSITGGSLGVAAMIILWFAALTSAFVGAIPIVTCLIPIVQSMIGSISEHYAADPSVTPDTIAAALWWSLALGACLGGNGTMFGTAANVVVVEIARQNRREVSFGQFLKVGMPITLVTAVISSVYVLLRYVF